MEWKTLLWLAAAATSSAACGGKPEEPSAPEEGEVPEAQSNVWENPDNSAVAVLEQWAARTAAGDRMAAAKLLVETNLELDKKRIELWKDWQLPKGGGIEMHDTMEFKSSEGRELVMGLWSWIDPRGLANHGTGIVEKMPGGEWRIPFENLTDWRTRGPVYLNRPDRRKEPSWSAVHNELEQNRMRLWKAEVARIRKAAGAMREENGEQDPGELIDSLVQNKDNWIWPQLLALLPDEIKFDPYPIKPRYPGSGTVPASLAPGIDNLRNWWWVYQIKSANAPQDALGDRTFEVVNSKIEGDKAIVLVSITAEVDSQMRERIASIGAQLVDGTWRFAPSLIKLVEGIAVAQDNAKPFEIPQDLYLWSLDANIELDDEIKAREKPARDKKREAERAERLAAAKAQPKTFPGHAEMDLEQVLRAYLGEIEAGRTANARSLLYENLNAGVGRYVPMPGQETLAGDYEHIKKRRDGVGISTMVPLLKVNSSWIDGDFGYLFGENTAISAETGLATVAAKRQLFMRADGAWFLVANPTGVSRLDLDGSLAEQLFMLRHRQNDEPGENQELIAKAADLIENAPAQPDPEAALAEYWKHYSAGNFGAEFLACFSYSAEDFRKLPNHWIDTLRATAKDGEGGEHVTAYQVLSSEVLEEAAGLLVEVELSSRPGRKRRIEIYLKKSGDRWGIVPGSHRLHSPWPDSRRVDGFGYLSETDFYKCQRALKNANRKGG